MLIRLGDDGEAHPPLRRTRPRPVDLLVTGAALLLSLSLAARFLVGLGASRAVPIALALVVHSASVAVLRTAPGPAFGVALAAGAVVVASGLPTVVLGLTPLLATWYLAASAPPLVATSGLAIGLGATAWASAVLDGATASTTTSNLVAVLVAWTLGRQSAQRSARIAALHDRAEALARARDADAERAVAEERLRLAREMHDVVAHGLGAITVQAGAAAHVDLPPDEARRTLATIEQLSRRTTDELRSVLRVLRDESTLQHAPVPGLEDLPALVASCRETGMAVSFVVSGSERPVAPLVGPSLHRVVQEALTNVRKHAATPSAHVRVEWSKAHVTVEVADDGPSRSRPTGSGLGLVGMRERVQACGGALEAGPRADGAGFRVRATVPVGPAPQEATT